MARGRKKKSKDQHGGKPGQQDKTTASPAAKMSSAKRTANAMTDVMDDQPSDMDDQRPARRQRTTDTPPADGNAKPRFHTRLLSPKRPAPPPVASAVPAHHPLNPPHVTALSQKHRVEAITITRNCDMEPKIRRIRELLMQQQQSQQSKDTAQTQPGPVIVTVSAREDAAGKAVSIVEIVKALFRDDDLVCYQYTAPWSRLELLPGPMEAKFGPGRRLGDGAVTSGDDHKDEDEDMPDGETQGDAASRVGGTTGTSSREPGSQRFQVMEESRRPKVRNIALTTCYLSREPVVELRQLFGQVIRWDSSYTAD